MGRCSECGSRRGSQPWEHPPGPAIQPAAQPRCTSFIPGSFSPSGSLSPGPALSSRACCLPSLASMCGPWPSLTTFPMLSPQPASNVQMPQGWPREPSHRGVCGARGREHEDPKVPARVPHTRDLPQPLLFSHRFEASIPEDLPVLHGHFLTSAPRAQRAGAVSPGAPGPGWVLRRCGASLFRNQVHACRRPLGAAHPHGGPIFTSRTRACTHSTPKCPCSLAWFGVTLAFLPLSRLFSFSKQSGITSLMFNKVKKWVEN